MIFHINNSPWNKGLTKETSKKVAAYSKKLSEVKKGKPAPEKGKEARMRGLKKSWEKNTLPIGTIKQTHNLGYWKIKTLNGWEYLHRYIVEQERGITIKTTEHVHHVDEDVSNNHIDNLEVRWVGNHLHHHLDKIPSKLVSLICPLCGVEFKIPPHQVPEANKHYCSRKCLGKASQKRIYLNCPTCKKKYYRTISQFNESKRHFCSAECWYSRTKK